MDRRMFLMTALAGSAAAGMAGTAAAAERFFPTKVDMSLFEGMNRVKDAGKKTPLEKGHAPVIIAPKTVKGGEPFTVEIVVGETLHPMGPTHWIEYIEFAIGNEPAGKVDFQPKGYLKPKVTFTTVVSKEAAPTGKVTLMARQRCNLHGLWEGSIDIDVT